MLVAGIDSSTQSCKVVICDADSGEVVRTGRASHPDGTSCPPEAWWQACQQAIAQAGGLRDVAAVSVGGQQHGMVCLDAEGRVIRDALLWNDTRSAGAAADLVAELGAREWADAVGSVPVASYTVTKLRWLADHEPHNADKLAAVCLPHDWLTWQLSGAEGLDTLVTDRSDASGTAYFDPVGNEYRRDLLALALRCDATRAEEIVLPRVLGPNDAAGQTADGVVVGPGCGDNAGAGLGLGVTEDEFWLSLGTSGVVAGVSATPFHDDSGLISGFADASGRYLPLQCTLNASTIVDHIRALLGVGYEEFSQLALEAPPGAQGVVLLPYFAHERTPNLPLATATLGGLTTGNTTRANLARAAVEAMLSSLAECVARISAAPQRLLMVGGGAQLEATRQIAPTVLGHPVDVPQPAEYVALGAAMQAAWVVQGGSKPPQWHPVSTQRYEAEPGPAWKQYREFFSQMHEGQ